MGMIDKEKVLHGLDSCGFHDGIPNICGITECPYRDNKAYCVHELAHDAGILISELLKAQEPRVMTLEEAQNALHNDTVVWVELKGKMLCGGIRMEGTDYFMMQNDDVLDVTDFDSGDGLEAYGKDVRCWTSRPTDEQREATPWE